jgi:hypothetical protein
MNLSKGINRLSIAAGIVGIAIFAYLPGRSDPWYSVLIVLALGFLIFWGVVRLIGWIIKGFMSKQAERKDK